MRRKFAKTPNVKNEKLKVFEVKMLNVSHR